MVRKVIGIILTVLGGIGCVVLLTYGGAILPHIFGPLALMVIGLFLLTVRRRGKRNE